MTLNKLNYIYRPKKSFKIQKDLDKLSNNALFSKDNNNDFHSHHK